MWRALFVALGFYCIVVGIECLLIDKAVWSERIKDTNTFTRTFQPNERELVPPDWAPWSLMSTGAVTMLYSFTLKRGGGGGGEGHH